MDGLNRAPASTSTGEIVFTFSTVDWHTAYRRGLYMPEDKLVTSLLANPRVAELLVCSLPRNRALRWLEDLHGGKSAPFSHGEHAHLVEPGWWLRRKLPTTPETVSRAFAGYDRQLARAVKNHGLSRPHVITASPFVAGFCELAWAESVTWYAVDDWVEHPAYSRWHEVFHEAYQRVRDYKRRVAAVSAPLLERLAPEAESILVPNGITPHEWQGQHPVPEWAAALPRPIFIYVGALDHRVNMEWIRQLAQAEPNGTILFVGTLADPENFDSIRDLPNVVIRPSVDRSTLCGLIEHADVGLLPHHATRLTASMSPMKLSEYLAGGLPAVATDLPPVRTVWEGRVELLAPDGDFVAAARAALALGRASEEERQRFIMANSWQTRHDQIVDLTLS